MVASEQFLQTVTDQMKLVRDEIGKVIVGHDDVVEGVIIALVAGGHVLLEGVPGLGKTTLLRTLGRAMHLDDSRIQFTPDLMPADIVGSMVLEADSLGSKELRFQPGPIFAHLVLADEINRATPRTQSALLEAMQERTVTTGTTTHQLEDPFLVMATQNPLEMEGTYPLPEAQLDRFLLKLVVRYPTKQEMEEIVDRTMAPQSPVVHQVMDREQVLDARRGAHDVLIAPHVRDFAIRLILSTQPEREEAHASAKKYIRYGSSPRGAQALIQAGRVRSLMRGRLNVSLGDLRELALPALRHRIILNFDAHAEGKTADQVLNGIIESLPEGTL
ncbi:MAG: MoxR family ATPase [Bryobacterales bacterium]|nr:MoxR family ATPase [Bryobacterales bacterium]MDE0295229.1 MoxR family ATPase [Bryobacterales bacterium]MDE0433319.1 MoxR family ATPase [Bryobacterales bacterium]